MKLIFDGRLLTSKPSGVRDITLGLVSGLRQLEKEAQLDLLIVGDRPHDEIDVILRSRGYMHLLLPAAAVRYRANRIMVPRQTVPIISPVPTIPVFMDIGFLRIPEVYARHLVRDVTTKLAAKSREILAISEYTASELAQEGLSDCVRPLPIQAIHSLNWTPASEDRYLLCVAAQEPHKNLVRLVEAWAGVEKDGWRLVICGRRGGATSALEAAISDRKLGGSVQVVSGLDDSAYASLLGHCSAYIQPSFDEGLCIPALDLAAAGAPTAVSELGNLGLLYSNSGISSSFDPYSVPAIRDSIEQLLNDENYRKRVSAWNLENIAVTDWRAVAETAMKGLLS